MQIATIILSHVSPEVVSPGSLQGLMSGPLKRGKSFSFSGASRTFLGEIHQGETMRNYATLHNPLGNEAGLFLSITQITDAYHMCMYLASDLAVPSAN